MDNPLAEEPPGRCRYGLIAHYTALRQAEELAPAYPEAADMLGKIAVLAHGQKQNLKEALNQVQLFPLKHPLLVERKTLKLIEHSLTNHWDHALAA